MQEYLIVDGYNIIGAWPALTKLKEVNLEEARDRLIDILANYQGYSGMRILIVFDAHQVPGLGREYNRSKLKVIYTREKETADECIERLVAELSQKRVRIHVATSDFVEQHVTFGKGALRISARELLIMVQQSGKEISAKIEGERGPRGSTFDNALSKEIRNIFEKWRRSRE
ncbi:NYN domain-containing protein [Ferviditalea candida]|uniref:NYN domain-containing protein n=1 Tax=Ferviditalea candida TaxID=3108399 RepID=A0ABU5ZPF8_9BACL|nr:NYN domain-containing protein [Paenibacillaceae bacterium T2]